MASDRDLRLVELFDRAVVLPAQQRRAFVLDACSDDAPLAERVLALLAADGDDDRGLSAIIARGTERVAAAQSIAAGTRLGPWRVLQELGRGGMGTVLLAERADDEYRRRVAIKLIGGFPDRERLERLRAERQILADLNHPNIARLLDGGSSEDGQPYLVLEFIDGAPIDRCCAERRTPTRERVRMMIELAQAVHYAHQRLVIHRDIKPGNVLVGADGVPKLLDFGIARLVEVGEPAQDRTQVRYYTPHYSSPEQVEGRAVSTLGDVFSLGRLLETVLGAGSEAPVVEREAAAIIARATAAAPEDRYPSASALAADLERWRDGYAVEALRRRAGYRLQRFLLRHRAAVGATLLAMVIAAGLVWRTVLESERARLAAARAEQTLAFVTRLIESARPESSQGRAVTVAEVLERGDAELDDPRIAPALRAGIATTLASAWHALDEFPRAAKLYAQAANAAAAAGDRGGELAARAKYLVVQTRAGRVRETTAEATQVRAAIDAWPAAEATLRADILNDWAVWAIDAGHAAEAREVLVEAIKLRQTQADQAALAASEHNLALAEERLGNFDAAMTMLEGSLARKQRLLGPDHPSTLIGLRSMAVIARRAGRYQIADQALNVLLQQRIRLFGADHPALSADYNVRANGLHDAGDYARAIALYQRALALDEALAGAPSRHIYLNNLASAYEDRGEAERALPLYRGSLDLREQRFGADHADTLRARHNLARILLAVGKPDAALALAKQNLEDRRRTLGPEHPDVTQSAALLAQIEFARAPTAASLATLDRAATALFKQNAPSSLRALYTHGVLGGALRRLGLWSRAREHLQGAIHGYRDAFGSDHPKAAELELELARIDRAEGHAKAAAERLSRAAPILNRALAAPAPALQLLACLQQQTTATSCE